MPKSRKFGLSWLSHEDVAGLEIAVDDEALMRVPDRITYLEEEPRVGLSCSGLAAGVIVEL